jgi:kynureninase
LDGVAGFLALRAPNAGELSRALRTKGVFTDARHDILRLGPAPYVTDGQIDQALGELKTVVAG